MISDHQRTSWPRPAHSLVGLPVRLGDGVRLSEADGTLPDALVDESGVVRRTEQRQEERRPIAQRR